MADNASLLLQQVALWNAKHPAQQIDPAAELAVARQEGLSGGIGDGGHAFGPNQLNNSGGVITGKFSGMTPAQINAWAWSPAGIQYALAGIAKVAGGLKGQAAVTNIVSRFERPANIPRETANALAALGLPAPSGGTLPPAAGSTQAPGVASQAAQQAAAQLHTLATLRALLAQPTPKAAAVNPGFAPISLPATVAAQPVAAFHSPLTGQYGSPLASLAR